MPFAVHTPPFFQTLRVFEYSNVSRRNKNPVAARRTTTKAHTTGLSSASGNDISNWLVDVHSLPIAAAAELPWLTCDAVLSLAAHHTNGTTIKRQPKIESNGNDKEKKHKPRESDCEVECRISNFAQYARFIGPAIPARAVWNALQHVPYCTARTNRCEIRKKKKWDRSFGFAHRKRWRICSLHAAEAKKTNTTPKNSDFSAGACDAQTSRYEWPNKNVSDRVFHFLRAALLLCLCMSIYKCVKTH